MYMNVDEFVFIIAAVLTALVVYKLTGSIFKGIGRLFVKLGARVLRKELQVIELQKAAEAAERQVNEKM